MAADSTIEIETKLAHQEYMLGELNDALTSQQTQISTLETQVRALMDRVRALSDAAPEVGDDDAPPPHY